MLSDRKHTVSYAIDLLRAHQIRRENLFLHEELKSCRKEIANLHEKVKDARTAIQASHDASEKTRCTLEEQNIRLIDQGDGLQALQQGYDTIQSEVSSLKTTYNQGLEHTQAQWERLNKEIDTVRTNCQNVADVRQKHEGIMASLTRLEHTMVGKADASVVEALAVQVNELPGPPPAAGGSSASVSRIEDSFEPQLSPCVPGNNMVQIRDSQGGRPPGRTETPHEQHWPDHLHRREATLPDDLDLDENANTFSYVGHQTAAHQEEIDTLQTLPQPDMHTSQLARVNLLRQRRFDDWEYYYSQGLTLIEALPRTFEETIVRNFINGMFLEAQRKQCQQLLDAKGWTWDNVVLFGKVCSQLSTGSEAGTLVENAEASKSSRKLTEALGRLGKSKAQRKERAHRKIKALGCQPGADTGPLRRSQRLVEKEDRNQRQSKQPRAGSRPPDAPLPRACGMTGTTKLGTRSEIAQPALRQRAMQQNNPSPRVQDSSAEVAVERQGQLDQVMAGVQPVEIVVPAQNSDTAPGKDSGVPESVRPPPIIAGKMLSKPAVFDLQRKRAGPVRSIPRLVPHKRRVAESAGESSNDEGFLRKPQALKDLGWGIKGTKQKKQEKRHLPLPPPPEIPILPTSSEE
ncbi:hypothetical protein A1O3_07387 [Capronia epimyces CBS 606.96]|uniref:Uncharacterized protein n=1 Tax=Capronia epimyces CBS 606.96 TaxID=1182542 RepID=W9YFM1_9EURO|nr:uncharacterized protein A1O3_07387 [Capronia epimyces CBS 606.96]EXJ81099.1 hypothetical protein A1O3_07387 [Capronia epimyces CBS 606.96]